MMDSLAGSVRLVDLDIVALDFAVEDPLHGFLQIGRRPQLGKVAADERGWRPDRHGGRLLALEEDNLETRADGQEEDV